MSFNKIILIISSLCVIFIASYACSAENKNDKNIYVTLNSGYKMPVLGLGTWTLDNKTAENAVYHALKTGYRLIDTAKYYGNERGVGAGVRRAINDKIVKREDVFITTKILPSKNPYNDIDACNNALGLEYIDLMLIHQPGFNDESTYKALEKGVKSGKIKSIGISNYYTPDDFERMTRNAEIMPAVIQNENHIYYQNTDLQNYVKKYGIFIESWYPFGGRGNTHENLGNETIIKIAKSHGKTPAQIILRWNIQSGFIVIPGSGNNKHITENFDVFNFELSNNEMREIAKLNKNRRYENW